MATTAKKKTTTKTTKKKEDVEFGWHFLPSDMKLTFNDKRIARVGETLEMKEKSLKPQICQVGMHASVRPSQAAHFERGLVLCRVAVSGDISRGNDKFCGRRRTVIWAQEIKDKDMLDFCKEIYPPYADNGTSAYDLDRLARYDCDKFDAVIEKWAKKNGWKSDDVSKVDIVKIQYVKQDLTKGAVKMFLSDRFVRTAAEIVKDMKNVYELDGSGGDGDLEDVLWKLEANGEICEVSSYAPNGDNGYVLRRRKR